MVDSTEAMESSFVSVDLVKRSSTKKLVVVDPGVYEVDDFKNRKLTLGVNIDGKVKKYRPNKETVENLQVLGKDTNNWVGKIIQLEIGTRASKEAVIGRPADQVNIPEKIIPI